MRNLHESLIAVASAVAALVVRLLANAELPNFPSIDFGNLTATAILGWYAWHTTTRTIPQLVADFRQELTALREAFREELASERELHRCELERLQGDANRN